MVTAIDSVVAAPMNQTGNGIAVDLGPWQRRGSEYTYFIVASYFLAAGESLLPFLAIAGVTPTLLGLGSIVYLVSTPAFLGWILVRRFRATMDTYADKHPADLVDRFRRLSILRFIPILLLLVVIGLVKLPWTSALARLTETSLTGTLFLFSLVFLVEMNVMNLAIFMLYLKLDYGMLVDTNLRAAIESEADKALVYVDNSISQCNNLLFESHPRIRFKEDVSLWSTLALCPGMVEHNLQDLRRSFKVSAVDFVYSVASLLGQTPASITMPTSYSREFGKVLAPYAAVLATASAVIEILVPLAPILHS